MSERRQFIRIIPTDKPTGTGVFNLARMRFETVATQDTVNGTIKTLQSGEDRIPNNAVPNVGELPRRFLENLFRAPFRKESSRAA